ncbi:alpha/beta hydrolase [Candidatus Roizmanbacteria bacterium]|nr:alpha/beta hydrolase [Candidatus Roizmanbacteria bacterium]
MKEHLVITLKDGRRLGYAEYGNLKGEPLFFFHGWPSCRFHGQRFEIIAKKLHIRLIAPDRPGFGNSDFKKGRTLLDWANDVIELADHLKIKSFPVLGISGGGPYAAVCAYALSKRITKVGIVVALAPPYIKGMLDGMALQNKLAWGFLFRFSAGRYLILFLQLIHIRYFPFLQVPVYSSKDDQKLIKPEFNKRFMLTIAEAMKQGVKGVAYDLKLYTSDLGFPLHKIKAKTYIWYGETDKNVSVNMGTYYHENIPNSELTLYPNEGHIAQLTHAEEILSTLM